MGRFGRLTHWRAGRNADASETKRGARMTTSAKKGLALQWQMLIGFLVGLIARPDRLFDAARRGLGRDRHHLCHPADRPDLPAPAVHAGDPAAVLGAGRRHFGNGRSPLAEARRPQDARLHGRRLVDRRRGQPGRREPASARRRRRPCGRRSRCSQRIRGPGRRDHQDRRRAADRASTPSSTSSPTISSR